MENVYLLDNTQKYTTCFPYYVFGYCYTQTLVGIVCFVCTRCDTIIAHKGPLWVYGFGRRLTVVCLFCDNTHKALSPHPPYPLLPNVVKTHTNSVYIMISRQQEICMSLHAIPNFDSEKASSALAVKYTQVKRPVENLHPLLHRSISYA